MSEHNSVNQTSLLMILYSVMMAYQQVQISARMVPCLGKHHIYLPIQWRRIQSCDNKTISVVTTATLCHTQTNPSRCILLCSSSAFLLVSTNINVLLWLSPIMFWSSFCNLHHMHQHAHRSHQQTQWPILCRVGC